MPGEGPWGRAAVGSLPTAVLVRVGGLRTAGYLRGEREPRPTSGSAPANAVVVRICPDAVRGLDNRTPRERMTAPFIAGVGTDPRIGPRATPLN